MNNHDWAKVKLACEQFLNGEVGSDSPEITSRDLLGLLNERDAVAVERDRLLRTLETRAEREKEMLEEVYKTAFDNGRDACIKRVKELECDATDTEYRMLGYVAAELSKVKNEKNNSWRFGPCG